MAKDPPPVAAEQVGEVLDVVDAHDPGMQLAAPAARMMAPSLANMSIERLGDIFAQSGMFKDASDPAKAIVKIIAGAELGLSPFASMTGIYMVDGKPTVGGHLLAGILRTHKRYRYQILQLTNALCELAFFEVDAATGEWSEMSPHSVFTIEDAQQAQLMGKHNWKAYPRNMLFWRALSNGVKFHAPDIFGGIPVYTPDEAGIEVQPDGSVRGDDGPRPGAATARTSLPPRASAVAPAPVGHTTTAATPHAQQPGDRFLNANEKRKLWALATEAGIKSNEPLLRVLFEWITGESSSSRVTLAKRDELYEAITDYQATLALVMDLAASGDERARAILTRYMPDELPDVKTDDDPPPEDDLSDPERLPL